MDPSETLRDIRELVTAWHEADLHSVEREVAEDLVTRVESLDAWLTSGGFLPSAWGERASCTDPDKREFHCCGLDETEGRAMLGTYEESEAHASEMICQHGGAPGRQVYHWYARARAAAFRVRF